MIQVADTLENYDKSAGRLFAIYLIIEACNKLLKSVINIPFVSENATYLLGMAFILCMIREWKYISSSFRRLLFWESLFVFIIGLSLVLRPEYSYLIVKRCIWTVAFCVPFFCIGMGVSNRWRFIEQTKVATFFVDISMLFILYAEYVLGMAPEYDMSLGYMLLYPLLFHICKVKECKRYLILIGIEIFVIFVYGSRGPIVCCGVFLILFYIIKEIKNRRPKVVLSRIALLSLLFLVVFFAYFFMDKFITVLDGLGISSRTLSMFSEGNFFQHSTRSELWLETCTHILEKPILGWGIAGFVSCMEQYPHLIFLEIVLDYGLFFGIVFGLFILYHISVALFHTRFREVSILIFFSCGLCPLMLSSTYLQEPMFWLLLSFCVSISRRAICFKWNKI